MSQNGTDKHVIQCPHCKQRFSVVMPKMDLFNDLRVSVGVAPHEKPIRCICGKKSVVAIKQIVMEWIILPITDEQAATLEDPSVIVAPASALGHLH